MRSKLTGLILGLIITLSIVPDLVAQERSDERPRVEITTDVGRMIVELYNETPQHRDNFLKLVQEGFYDSLLFHRIITDFMVQGGDPGSKQATPGATLGNGGPGYTIPAEIQPGLVHVKGALAAARQSDQVNPEKRSSGSQFYIVQGKLFSPAELEQLNASKKNRYMQVHSREYFADPANQGEMERYRAFASAQDTAGIRQCNERMGVWVIEKHGPAPEVTYTPEQIKTISTLGGAPHLDGDYTVFGQVVEGLEVIDAIAALERDGRDRPVNDLRMFMRVIE